MSGNSFSSSSSLLLPLGSHLETSLKPRQGPEVKRTIAHPLDKVNNLYFRLNVFVQMNLAFIFYFLNPFLNYRWFTLVIK